MKTRERGRITIDIKDVIIRHVEPHDILGMWQLGIGRELFIAVRKWCEIKNVRWLQWQSSEKAIPFYESFGLKGDRCPDPVHPFFEIEFNTKSKLSL
jgi:hypothetical protein